MEKSRWKQSTREAFEKILEEPGVTGYEGINNPIKIMGDTTIVYVMYAGKVYECFVDTEDLPIIAVDRTWVARGREITDVLYAIAGSGIGRTNCSMHRLISNSKKGDIIDHIDRNGLNNKKSNLWNTTTAMNLFKKTDYKSNTSGARNIVLAKTGWYLVRNVIRFKNLDIAIRARDESREVMKKYIIEDSEYRKPESGQGNIV
jgi:hypothetical protein